MSPPDPSRKSGNRYENKERVPQGSPLSHRKAQRKHAITNTLKKGVNFNNKNIIGFPYTRDPKYRKTLKKIQVLMAIWHHQLAINSIMFQYKYNQRYCRYNIAPKT